VKDGRDADLRLEPLFAEGEQGGAGAGKEQVVKRPLVWAMSGLSTWGRVKTT